MVRGYNNRYREGLYQQIRGVSITTDMGRGYNTRYDEGL
jgi:hypothetical protein